MRTPDLSKALDSFSSMISEKKHLAEKERGIVDKINRAIKGTGYRVVPMDQPMTGRRRGRPVGSRNKPKQHMPSASMNGAGKRGPGRPKLRKVA